jgi:hypothetical protein
MMGIDRNTIDPMKTYTSKAEDRSRASHVSYVYGGRMAEIERKRTVRVVADTAARHGAFRVGSADWPAGRTVSRSSSSRNFCGNVGVSAAGRPHVSPHGKRKQYYSYPGSVETWSRPTRQRLIRCGSITFLPPPARYRGKNSPS